MTLIDEIRGIVTTLLCVVSLAVGVGVAYRFDPRCADLSTRMLACTNPKECRLVARFKDRRECELIAKQAGPLSGLFCE
jgi:hypothetical protein